MVCILDIFHCVGTVSTVDSSSLRLTEYSVQSVHHCFTKKVKSRGDIESGPKVLLGLITLTKGVLIARLDQMELVKLWARLNTSESYQ